MNFNNRHTTIQEIENNVSPFLLSLVIQFNISEPTVVNFIMPYVYRMSSGCNLCLDIKTSNAFVIKSIQKQSSDSKEDCIVCESVIGKRIVEFILHDWHHDVGLDVKIPEHLWHYIEKLRHRATILKVFFNFGIICVCQSRVFCQILKKSFGLIPLK